MTTVTRSNILDTLEFKDQHLYRRTKIRGDNYQGPINGSCNRPSTTVLITRDLDVYVCICDGWLPIPVGKVLDFNSIDEIFASPKAKILQQDVADKKFTWCAVTQCGVTKWDMQLNYLHLSINIDESCNLACPSCRREKIMLDSGPEFESKLKSVERVLSWLEKYQDPAHIVISGNGDCLASHIMRPIVLNYKPKAGQTFELFTNGLLMKKILSSSPLLPHITSFRISVDAGSAEVYKVVRQPGRWDILINNLDWLDANRGNATVSLVFTVQQKNYQDIFNFIKICYERNYLTDITQLNDWATWSSDDVPRGTYDQFTIKNGTFDDNNVLDPRHPEHQECVKLLKRTRMLGVPLMPSIQMLLNSE
jgi:molybdenum cofactor biosynthesis enzyme MoaA